LTHSAAERAAIPPAPARIRLSRVLVLVVVLVAVGAVWVLVTGLRARSDLQSLRRDVTKLRTDLVAGRQAAARQDLADAQATAAAAHDRTDGPAWWIGAHVPGLGGPLGTVRTIAAVGYSLSRDVMPSIVDGGVALDPQQLRVGADQIDLARLQQAAPALSRALPGLAAARARIAGAGDSWLEPVSSGRQSALTALTSFEGTLHDAVLATGLLPSMLGGSTPRTYLVVFEGDNEVRALGGIFGGYGLLRADAGRLQFTSFGSDAGFSGTTAQVDLGPAFEKAYSGKDAYQSVQDADVGPHFPDAAKIWTSIAEQHLGVSSIDGVIAIDPVVMARILEVVGPVRTPDGTSVTAANLVHLLDVGVYERFDSGDEDVDNANRKAFFVSVAQAVTDAALARSISTTRLLHVLAKSAGEHRLVVYSSSRSEEVQLAGTPLGGTLPANRQPFVRLAFNNESGTKLDYFLHASLTYQRSSCSASPATVTVKLENTAPSSGLPAYMTEGVQWGDVAHPPGTESEIVNLYTTYGSSVTGVTLDGVPIGTYTASDRGHPLTETLVTLMPGQAVTMVFSVNEPAASGATQVALQPLAQPMTARVAAPTGCSTGRAS
jgi:hypothetical protein